MPTTSLLEVLQRIERSIGETGSAAPPGFDLKHLDINLLERLWRQKPTPLDKFVTMELDSAS